jgi:hypothetical protein
MTVQIVTKLNRGGLIHGMPNAGTNLSAGTVTPDTKVIRSQSATRQAPSKLGPHPTRSGFDRRSVL